MTNLTQLDPTLDTPAATCRVIVETPKGSRAKLAYDPEAGAFEIKRMLPDGMSFPLDFGFVPSTRGEDGDPVDILVLNDEPSPMGALLTVRLIGVIEANQTEDGKTVRNDRILAVATVSHLFERVRAPGDLGEEFMHNLGRFWINYGALRGAKFEIIQVADAKAAVEAIQKARRG